MFKRLGFLISFTKIYEVFIDICIIYGLRDSCNLDVNRGVGVYRTMPSDERLPLGRCPSMFPSPTTFQLI